VISIKMKKGFQISIKIFLFIAIIGIATWFICKLPVHKLKQTLANVGLEQSRYSCEIK